MNSSSISYKPTAKLWPWAIIALSVVWQLHSIVRGFDLTDEGYLMSVYQWFGTDVDAAKGAGGYPLTCWLGWWLNSLTPQGGLLAMRLWGVLLVTLTEVVAYLWLRRWFPSRLLLVGLLIQLVFVSGDPKPLGYNALAALCYLLALMTAVEGIVRRQLSWLVVSGMLLGINIFVRLPNIIGLVLIFLPVGIRFTQKSYTWQRVLTDSLCMAVGALLAFWLGWLAVVHIGAHGQVHEFIASLTGQLGGQSSHASGTMLLTYLKNYGEALLYTVFWLIAVVLSKVALHLRHKWKGVLLLLLLTAVLVWLLYIKSDILGHRILSMMNGVAILGCLWVLFSDQTERRPYALAALAMVLLCPLGSDRGFVTMWAGTWLALPLALALLHEKWGKGVVMAACMLLLCVVLKIELKAYYDPEPKVLKTATIDSPLAWGVHTSQRKAEVLNPLLAQLHSRVKPGDTLLIYDDSPMLYYLTATKPFAGISWPGVFYGQRYVDAFQAAERTSKELPLVVLQHFSTSGAWTEPDSARYDLSQQDNDDLLLMRGNVVRFLQRHGYQAVWNNDYYTIFAISNHQTL